MSLPWEGVDVERGTLVLVSYHFPPDASAGSIRTGALARWLTDDGWKVVALSPAPEVHPLKDEELAGMLDGVEVRRTFCPRVYRGGGGRAGEARRGARKTRGYVSAFVRGAARAADAGILGPDRMSAWLPWLIPALRKTIEEVRPAAVVCSGPPFSSFVGAAVAVRRSGTPLILDYRDPWGLFPDWSFDESLRERTTLGVRARLRFERRLESWVLSRATGLTAVTPGLRRRILEAAPDNRLKASAVVRNGVEAGMLRRALQSPPGARAAGRYSLVHVGNFYGPHGARHLLAGLAWLAKHHPHTYDKLSVHFYGSFRPSDLEFAGQCGLLDCISVLGPVSYSDGLRAILEADGLLLCLPPCSNAQCWIPMKTYSYLASGRPVLAVVPEGELSDYLSDVRRVIRCRPDAPEAVGRGILRLIEGGTTGRDVTFDYSFDSSLHRITGLLEDICRRGTNIR